MNCAGHTRFKAALERNEKIFPVMVVPDVQETAA